MNDLFVNLGTLPSNQHQFLALSRPHRDEQPPSLRQLVHERGRHRRRRGRNHDDVEWSILPPTDGAVSDHERHVVDPELIQHGARSHREFTDPFDRVDALCRKRQQGRQEPTSRADFQHGVVGSHLEDREVERLERRLGRRLAVSDRGRCIFVGSRPHPFRNKKVPGNTIEKLKDRQIVDSSYSDMLYQLSPVPGKPAVV